MSLNGGRLSTQALEGIVELSGPADQNSQRPAGNWPKQVLFHSGGHPQRHRQTAFFSLGKHLHALLDHGAANSVLCICVVSTISLIQQLPFETCYSSRSPTSFGLSAVFTVAEALWKSYKFGKYWTHLEISTPRGSRKQS